MVDFPSEKFSGSTEHRNSWYLSMMGLELATPRSEQLVYNREVASLVPSSAMSIISTAKYRRTGESEN